MQERWPVWTELARKRHAAQAYRLDDQLSRALFDFAKPVETFDAAGTSFVGRQFQTSPAWDDCRR